MTIRNRETKRQLMVIATPRSGSTLFTRCLSKAINVPALHEAQIGITLNKVILKTARKKYDSSTTPQERNVHHKIHQQNKESLIETHLKDDVNIYPIRKEMAAISILDMHPLHAMEKYGYYTKEVKKIASQKYFDDINRECAHSALPIIVITASPIDIMHSIMRSLLEQQKEVSIPKETFNTIKEIASETAKQNYDNILKLKEIFNERRQPYIEVTRDQILSDLTGTVNHTITASKVLGEASHELSPIRLYDGVPPSSGTVEYALSYNDNFVSNHERQHNFFQPRSAGASLSERLKETIAQKVNAPIEEIISDLEAEEEKLRALYYHGESR